MIVDIQSRPFSLTSPLRRYVRNKIQSSIEARTDAIQRIDVRLSDINGPHGGIDKRCHIHLVIPQQAAIVIKDTQENLYIAIDRAIARAREVLDRKLSRKRQLTQNPVSAFRELSAQADIA